MKLNRTKLAIAMLLGLVLGLAMLFLQPSVPTARAAIGDTTNVNGGELKAVELLAATTATNSPPSANAGLSVNELRQLGAMPERAVLAIASTAGSGTMTATFRIWGKLPIGGGIWFPMGPGTDALKGVINLTTAIGETGTDTIRHSEIVDRLAMFERIYLEVTAIGGTSTSVTAWLVFERPR